MRSMLRSDYRDLIDAAVQQGWRCELTKKSHLRMIPPNHNPIVIGSSTPGSKDSFRDFKADLRRSGLVLPK